MGQKNGNAGFADLVNDGWEKPEGDIETLINNPEIMEKCREWARLLEQT